MKLKVMFASAISVAALSLAGPAFAGGTTTGADNCSNTNSGSISVGQGTVQCNNANVSPGVVVNPVVDVTLDPVISL